MRCVSCRSLDNEIEYLWHWRNYCIEANRDCVDQFSNSNISDDTVSEESEEIIDDSSDEEDLIKDVNLSFSFHNYRCSFSLLCPYIFILTPPFLKLDSYQSIHSTIKTICTQSFCLLSLLPYSSRSFATKKLPLFE